MFIVAFYLMQKFARKGPTAIAAEQATLEKQEAELLNEFNSKGENA